MKSRCKSPCQQAFDAGHTRTAQTGIPLPGPPLHEPEAMSDITTIESMSLMLGGQCWQLDVDRALVPFVREILSYPLSTISAEKQAPAEIMRVRLAETDERALWQARHASKAGTNPTAIVQFSDPDHHWGRLTASTCEFEGPQGLEWIWLDQPRQLLTVGGGILLNAWMRRWRSDWLPVHAAAIGRDGRFVLVPGAGGAGKSTLSAAALAAGWQVIADDFAWICVIADGLRVESPYATLRLKPDARERLRASWPDWQPAARCDLRGDGKWVSAESCTHHSGRLCGVLRLAPSAQAAPVQALPSARALLPDFRTSHRMLNLAGAEGKGYLGALSNALATTPAGTLPRGPNLAENLMNIEQWLREI